MAHAPGPAGAATPPTGHHNQSPSLFEPLWSLSGQMHREDLAGHSKDLPDENSAQLPVTCRGGVVMPPHRGDVLDRYRAVLLQSPFMD